MKKTTLDELKPLGNRVLVRRLAAEEKLKGGIILPDTAKKKATSRSRRCRHRQKR